MRRRARRSDILLLVVDYATLQKCTELRDVHITEAVTSSESMEALLARFAEIAAPGKGAPIILAALARLGTTACDWIDGELRIELTGDATQTRIAASSSIGAGFREKLFADTVLRVPLAEFSRGIQRAPRLIEPLLAKETGTRIVLTVTQEVRKTSLPPPMVQIDPNSLMVLPRMTVPFGLDGDALSLPVASASAPVHAEPAPPPSSPQPLTSAQPPPKVVLRRRMRTP
jgi:hypothetical protein